ncbi:MAG: hypothetical protein ACREON_02760 [Gemmatimonadaceae bacterium]
MTPPSGGGSRWLRGWRPSRSSDANSMVEPPGDFCELLACFNAHEVEVLIVGAYALAFHGVPRMTGDLDLLVKPSAENAEQQMHVSGSGR